jgi:hypothetical protein
MLHTQAMNTSPTLLRKYNKQLINYRELVTALNRYEVVTPESFDNSIANAENNDQRIYFISNELIDSAKNKNEILDLFNKEPRIYNTEKLFFTADKIPNGFICGLNKSIFNKIEGHRILVPNDALKANNGADVLKQFNIPSQSTTKFETIKKVANRTNKQLLNYIYKTINDNADQVLLPRDLLVEAKKAALQQKNHFTQPAEAITTPWLEPEQPVIQEDEPVFEEAQSIKDYFAEFQQTKNSNKQNQIIQDIISDLREYIEFYKQEFIDSYKKLSSTKRPFFNEAFFTSDKIDKAELEKTNINPNDLATIVRVKRIDSNDKTTTSFICLHTAKKGQKPKITIHIMPRL